MENRVWEALHDKNGNYILPFFWMHGATEDVIRELVGKVDDCGIKAVCLESRPHPDYVGEQWWHDVDIILDEAQKRDMKVWILDDSHFPTGQANGAVVKAEPRLKRWSLMERHYDFKAPVCGEKYDVSHNLNREFMHRNNPEKFQEEVVAVLLGRKMPKGGQQAQYESIVDVTDAVEDGWLYVSETEGEFRIWVLTKKLHAAFQLGDGISNLEPESVRILIDTVYEAHYKRYASYFGNTIAGFFSDEPGYFNLGNAGYGMPDKMGQGNMPMPWSEGVLELLKEQFGEKTTTLLPYLYEGNGKQYNADAAAIRFRYMDILSKKYGENFTNQLGEWCQEHGVEYIGHIVEDYPMYERLGPSTGHYFRAIRGQAMAGIDVVLRQLLADQDEGRDEFYHYGLAQLAASLANQNTAQDGRAMCEIFGAFGWVEGVTMMKWMADHMLANGINIFVPHAFTEAEFPDPDCPPHFYARGNNPQYPFMEFVFKYMNRMAHMLQGGKPVVHNAVFFEAESDWVGESEPYFKLGKEFLTHQIPYHVLCMDFLKEAEVSDGKICVGKMSYDRLFVTKAEYMNQEYANVFGELEKKGAFLYFVDGKPCDYDGSQLVSLSKIPCVKREEVMEIAKKDADVQVIKETPQGLEKWLLVYPYKQGDMTLYVVFNASEKQEIHTRISFAQEKPSLCYDVLNQKMYELAELMEERGILTGNKLTAREGEVALHLAAGESLLLLTGYEEEMDVELVRPLQISGNKVAYTGKYDISLADYKDTASFGKAEESNHLYDIARKHPGFAGRVRYELSFTNNGYKLLLLRHCTEGVEVFLNEKKIGTRIAAPYLFDLTEAKEGKNSLRIELATTLVNAVPDGISCGGAIPPTGLLGPVEFIK